MFTVKIIFLREFVICRTPPHLNPRIVAVVEESMNNEIQIALVVQGRFPKRFKAIDLKLIGPLGVSYIEGVTGVDEVGA